MSDTREMDELAAKRWAAQEAERVADEQRRKQATLRAQQIEAQQASVNSYTPTEFVPGYFTFLVETKPCVYCKRPTVPRFNTGAYGAFHKRSFEAQRDGAGIQALSHHKGHSEPVCVGCKERGVEKFTCSHCKWERPLNQSHVSFGDPAEHLCTPCHETVPAKQWEGLVAELEETHRYDFE